MPREFHTDDSLYRYLSERIEFIDGVPFWVKPESNSLKPGDRAGSNVKGYIQIAHVRSGIKRYVMAHRLAWYKEYGEIPESIDHIDRNPSNNKISNLRVSDDQGQCFNRRNRSNSRSIYKGVYRDSYNKTKWRANITVNKVRHNLGMYDTEEEAAKAYDRKARELMPGNKFVLYNFPNHGEAGVLERSGDK